MDLSKTDPSKTDTGSILAHIKTLPFRIAVHAKHLGNNQEFGFNTQEKFAAASVIKLPLLLAVLQQVDEKKLQLNKRIEIKTDDFASGSGVLQFLDAGLQPTLKDALTLMIIVSDNTATNMCLDAIATDQTPGHEILNAQMQTWGFTNTQAVGKLQVVWEKKTIAQQQGALATVSTNDCISMLQQLQAGSLLSAASTEIAISILEKQVFTEMIGRHLPDGTRIATKSGQITGTRNDVGLVWKNNQAYAVAMLSEDVTDNSGSVENEAVKEIARLSKMIFDWMP